ncbi:MAG: tetratricopeptide repeat protein [Deltaproteobacteria bacterium]|nr:tetratricopeptide repeat protein [Deltaproteobacteria bacterium]
MHRVGATCGSRRAWRWSFGAVLALSAGLAGAQTVPDDAAPVDDLGATGLGDPGTPAEPVAAEPAAAEPLLPVSAAPPMFATTPANAGGVAIDPAQLDALFSPRPMYRAGLSSIVQNPPGAAEEAQLAEVLADHDAFARLVGDFHRYVDGFSYDWYRRRERDVQRTFRSQSATELDLQRRSRRAAIYYLEQFLREHPTDREYTPEAMYRLGDLYWEDENEAAALESRERRFTKTIELYRRLLTEFPDFPRRDGVHYVLGFSLQETPSEAFLSDDVQIGIASAIDPHQEEAFASFLAAVCANKVRYPPYAGPVAGPHRVAGVAPEWLYEPAPTEPALGARAVPPPSEEFRDLTDPGTPMHDYFKDCRPLYPDSKFIAPSWFVLAKSFQGRYAREFDDHNIEWAISAYRRVVDLGPRNNPYYAFALAEIGHALSGLNRYDDAMEPYRLFLEKLQAGEFGDYQAKAEGQQVNVLTGIATNLIYDYWNGPRATAEPAQRVSDPGLVAQDAEYFKPLMETLVSECCEEDKCDTWQKKAGVYRLFIQRFPLHPKVPQMLRKLVDLYRENTGEADQAARQGMMEAVECLALFRQSGGAGAGAVVAAPAAGGSNALCPDPTVGQRWWDENRDNPELLQEAEEQAEGALQDAAGQYHAAADTHQANCDAGQTDSCMLAARMYELAIEAYRQLLREYPSSAYTYDNMFNLANCLYVVGQTDDALHQYEAVENSTLSTTHQRDALFNQIVMLGNLYAASGQGLIPDEPPSHEEGAGDDLRRVPDPVPIPPSIAQWQTTMARWIQRYPDDPATLGYRRRIASQLFFLAHWDEAKAMYEVLFNEYCGVEAHTDLAIESWQILDTLARYAGDRERIEQLRNAAESGECFRASDTGRDIVEGIQVARIGEQFATASDQFERAAESGDPEAYRQSARMLLEVVNQHPDNPDSPAAIRMAAVAYGRAREPVLAVETWKRLIQHCSPPSQYVDNCDSSRADPSNRVRLPEAYFYVAINAMQTFDLDEAAGNFQALERSAGQIGRSTTLRPVQECLADQRRPCTDAEYTAEAVRATAQIRRLQGNWSEAARLTQRVVDQGYTRSSAEAMQMRLAVVEYYQQGSAWSDMRSAAEAYLRQYESDSARRFDVLQVRWWLYKDAVRQNNRSSIDRARTALESAYNRLSAAEKTVSGGQMTAAQAQLAIETQEVLAQPRFEALASKFREYDNYQFSTRNLRTLGDDIATFKDNLVRLAKELTAGYLGVIRDYPVSPTWGVASRYRISYVWNRLVLRLATLEQRLQPAWLEIPIGDGTLRDLLDEIAAGIRGVEVESGITIENIIRWYLIGDGTAATKNIIGAVPYARSTSASNEWVRSSIDLVRQLSLSDDPSQLFANGRLPGVTGQTFGGGLDPVAQ